MQLTHQIVYRYHPTRYHVPSLAEGLSPPPRGRLVFHARLVSPAGVYSFVKLVLVLSYPRY